MIVSMTCAVSAAEKTYSVDEAKEYLESYCELNTNSEGIEYSTRYEFDSEEDLEKVAMYLSEHGLAEFNATLEDELAKAVAKEPTIIQSRSTNPSTGYATISGNGKHTVSKTALGHVDFEKVGATEYRLNLGYTVNVSNNKITSISSISFDIPYISPTGSSWGNVRLPSVVKTSMCSVTANYDITKKMSIPIGQGEITVRSETKNEIFGLITNLK